MHGLGVICNRYRCIEMNNFYTIEYRINKMKHIFMKAYDHRGAEYTK